MTGSKSFEYYIQQDKIIIYAYLKDINKDNYSLDFDIILNLYKDYL